MEEFNVGRIGVLMGGASTEREISLKSGRAVSKALREKGLVTIELDILDENQLRIKELLKETRLDVAFVALHGRFGEDGQIQKILEELNIPYTGSRISACRLSMDKVISRKIFEKKGIPAPKYVTLNHRVKIGDILLDFPLVVKPATHGSSIGVSFVEKRSDLEDALKSAFSYDERVIVEEYIEGREITVGILEDRPLPVIEIIPQKTRLFSYQSKYTQGFTEYIVPAKLPEKIFKLAQKIGVAAHKAIRCRCFSRVDMILDRDDICRVLEVNSIPGLIEMSLLPKAARAVGIDYPELILKILRSALKDAKEDL